MSKRMTLIELLKAGGATAESLCEAVSITPKALNSQFATLRLMGICPVKNDEGTFDVVDREAWLQILEDRKSQAAAKKATKTPAEVHEIAVARLVRARKGKAHAEKLLKTGETELHELKDSRASIDVRIATIMYEDSLETLHEDDVEVMTDEDTGLLVVVAEETEEELA